MSVYPTLLNCCDLPVLNTNSKVTITEKLCYAFELLEQIIEFMSTLDFETAGFVTKEELISDYLLNPTSDTLSANFLGLWAGESKTGINNRITYGNFLGRWEGEKKSSFNDRMFYGDREGTWFGNTFEWLIDKIESGDFVGTFGNGSISKSYDEIIDLIVNGNFLGTWDGESKTSIDTRIESTETLAQSVLDLIASTPSLGITIYDGGLFGSLTTPTINDMGLLSETPTEEIDNGFLIYPCQCE